MPLPDDLHLRSAHGDDLPTIAALRESVGWAAHGWALRAVMDASDARCVVAVDAGDAVVAVGSGIAYGALGWVGNMVVADAHRRRGVGEAILADVVAFLADGRGCTRLELYATADGRPLYERHGFSLTDPSVFVRVPRDVAPGSADPAVEVAETREPDEVAAYDGPRFGGDRRRLLGMMAADPGRPLLTARVGSALAGYVWLRPDGPRIGPLLADTPEVAGALLGEAFRRVPAADELTMNLPTANEPGAAWLASLGAPLEPWDGRMARGSAIERRDETIYANLVGALG